jgi:plastocyanin
MIAKTMAVACLACAAVALAVSGIAGGGTKVTMLRGTVGPGFTITLTKAGKRVTRLAPGMYRIVVSDRSTIHNFVVEKSGGAFERSITSVGFMGTKTLNVRLTKGKWEFYCAPHESSMKGHFTVG